jgi:hypothetical protein
MAEKVSIFLIPEILTEILINVHPRQLLTSCIRVNKHWNSLINDSPPIRQALFLPLHNPSSKTKATGSQLNPLLTDYFTQYGPFPRHYINPSPRATTWHEYTSSSPRDVACRAAFSRKGATWRNMLWNYPDPDAKPTPWSDPRIPIRIEKDERWDGGQSKEGTVTSEKEWTMGRFYDLIEEHVEAGGNFWSEWTVDRSLSVFTVRMGEICAGNRRPDRDKWTCDDRESFDVDWVVNEGDRYWEYTDDGESSGFMVFD